MAAAATPTTYPRNRVKEYIMISRDQFLLLYFMLNPRSVRAYQASKSQIDAPHTLGTIARYLSTEDRMAFSTAHQYHLPFAALLELGVALGFDRVWPRLNARELTPTHANHPRRVALGHGRRYEHCRIHRAPQGALAYLHAFTLVAPACVHFRILDCRRSRWRHQIARPEPRRDDTTNDELLVTALRALRRDMDYLTLRWSRLDANQLDRVLGGLNGLQCHELIFFSTRSVRQWGRTTG